MEPVPRPALDCSAGQDLQPNPTASVAFLRAIIPAGPWPLTSIVPDGVTTTENVRGDRRGERDRVHHVGEHGGKGGRSYTSADCGRPISKPAKGDLIGARLLHVDSDPREDETTIEDAKTRALAAYRAHERPPSYIVRLWQRTAGGLAPQQEVPVPSGPARPE